jgi:prepilin-type N-terminal cleavage/methylation domain-containing protein
VVTSRKAFSLVELLIVILILGVLAGLVIIGLNVLGRPAKEKETRQTLHNLRNTLDELRNKTNLVNFYPPNDANWPRPLPAPLGSMLETGRKLDPVSKKATDWNPDQVLAICNTRVLMHKIRQVPANKDALNALPAQHLLKFTNAGNRTDDPILHESPVAVDGWGVPILCVPAEGLSGVTQGGVKNITVTSLRRRTETVNQGDAPLPGARPFFVSAGPDGKFEEGDDNIYSFED